MCRGGSQTEEPPGDLREPPGACSLHGTGGGDLDEARSNSRKPPLLV